MQSISGINTIASDQSVKRRFAAISLWTQQPAEALGLFLARAKSTGELNSDRSLRQVDGEIRHLGHHEDLDLTVAEGIEKLLALGIRGPAMNQRGIKAREIGRAHV